MSFCQLDWLPKVLTQKGDFLGFGFCRSRGSFATVPAMESRFLRCSSVADIHPRPHHALNSWPHRSAFYARTFGKQSKELDVFLVKVDGK